MSTHISRPWDDDWPVFPEGYLFDDNDDPKEVTIIGPSRTEDDVMTRWITARVEDAVPMEDCR